MIQELVLFALREATLLCENQPEASHLPFIMFSKAQGGWPLPQGVWLGGLEKCARHFGQCPTLAPLQRLIQVTGCRFDGPRRPTQAPYQRRDKNAHRGSPGGHAPLSSKGVYPCCRTWKPGEHLFQASRILPNRMRPVVFHAFGKAKKDAPKVLDELAQLGWEALPIALLGTPHYPAAWVVDTWKPIGGCSFTGSPTALAGNSAFRFCLLTQWHPQAVDPHHTPFQHGIPPDPDVEPVAPLRETDPELLVRQLLQAATDQHSQECRSQVVNKPSPSGLDPQNGSQASWHPRGPEVQAVPLPNLRDGVLHAVSLLPEPQQQEFRAAYTDAVESIPP